MAPTPPRQLVPAAVEEQKDYPGSTTLYVILACILAASGGLMFGYDIGISGTTPLSLIISKKVISGIGYMIVAKASPNQCDLFGKVIGGIGYIIITAKASPNQRD